MRRGAAVARRYAKALWALARDEGRPEPVAQELAAFERVLADQPLLRNVLLLPWAKAATKRAIVLSVAERVQLSPLARNFLALVAQRRRPPPPPVFPGPPPPAPPPPPPPPGPGAPGGGGPGGGRGGGAPGGPAPR